MQEAVRKAQEELAKQKEVIMAQEHELKVSTVYPFYSLLEKIRVVNSVVGSK